jgi:hypothetical protein
MSLNLQTSKYSQPITNPVHAFINILEWIICLRLPSLIFNLQNYLKDFDEI